MTRDELKAYIETSFGDRMTLLESGKVEPMYEVKADDLIEVATKLRDDLQLKFDFLCNMGGVDTGERLEVIYNIASTSKLHRLDFKVILGYDSPAIESIRPVWPGANWYEREMYELYGIDILNHDDLRPLLLPEDWDQGHPMRKDWDAPDFVRMPEL